MPYEGGPQPIGDENLEATWPEGRGLATFHRGHRRCGPSGLTWRPWPPPGGKFRGRQK